MLITGIAKSHWKEEERTYVHGKYRARSVSYDGAEIFLNSKTYLFGRQGAEATQIAAGTYKYNFMVELPKQLPESLSGSKGTIRYTIEVIFDIPWSFNKEFKKSFTVVRNDNLNDSSELKIPLQQKESRELNILPFQSSPCVFKITIPHRGYAAGQKIPIKIECNNTSKKTISETKIRFTRTFKYTSFTPRTKTKSKTEKLVEVRARGFKEGESKAIESSLKIPFNLPSSNSLYCRVIQISYSLEVEFVISGLNGNEKFIFPITLGAVGVGESIQTIQLTPNNNPLRASTVGCSSNYEDDLRMSIINLRIFWNILKL